MGLFLVIVIGYVIFVSSLDAREPAVNLFAVSSFKELEHFYYRLTSNNILATERELGCNKSGRYLKKSICRSIFSSFHFDYQHETLVEPSHWPIRRELKQSYRGIYKELFTDPDKSQQLSLKMMKRKKCRNPWFVRSVQIPGHPFTKITNEGVFVCLVRDKQTGRIKRYFVSREYNMNEAKNKNYIAGRFVFEGEGGNSLSVQALAELPAHIQTQGNVELVYLRAREGKNQARHAREDPVCRLDSTEKFRLCSTILNSSLYRRRVKFWPGSRSVALDSRSKAVEFRTTEAKQHAKHNVAYEEWVISCHAMSQYSHSWRTYYVSRGYSAKSAFIYKFLNEKLVLERRAVEVNLLPDDD